MAPQATEEDGNLGIYLEKESGEGIVDGRLEEGGSGSTRQDWMETCCLHWEQQSVIGSIYHLVMAI